MQKFTHLSLVAMAGLVLFACQLVGSPTVTAVPLGLRLTVQTQDGRSTFIQVGEVIPYIYTVTNMGTSPLTGPVIVVDAPRQVACPAVNSVGNLDAFLDTNETITCTGSYAVTQADIAAGSITNGATANAGGAISNQGSLTLTYAGGQPGSGLMLVKTASSQIYSQAGQTITYTYAITVTGSSPVGPTQFTISDDKLGAPFNCGPLDITLIPLETLACSATYTITQADMALPTLTNSASASGGGQTSAPVSVTLFNAVAPTPTATLAVAGTVESATTPASGTPNPTVEAAMRITFDPGQTTAARIGVLNPNQTLSYVVNAPQGQVLSLRLTVPANEVASGVNDPAGVALKSPDTTPTWSTNTTIGGDYLITLTSLVGTASVPYTLEVSLSTTQGSSSPTSQP